VTEGKPLDTKRQAPPTSKLHKSLGSVLRPPHKRRADANHNDERRYPPHKCEQPILSRGIYPAEEEALAEVDGKPCNKVAINTLPAVRT
jgi:hypothetical protein